MTINKWVLSVCAGALVSIVVGPAFADAGPAFVNNGPCSGLPNWQALKTALVNVVAAAGNGGLGFNMWGTLVANDGTVCAVAFSGSQYTYQWLGSRVISAQKANTAKRLQPRRWDDPCVQPFRDQGPCAFDRQSVHRSATGRQPIRFAAQQSRRDRNRIWQFRRRQSALGSGYFRHAE
jgi:hypothetical protein